ncbi:MAG: hypothetical protein ACPGMR_11500 [Pontibacterium sp.]
MSVEKNKFFEAAGAFIDGIKGTAIQLLQSKMEYDLIESQGNGGVTGVAAQPQYFIAPQTVTEPTEQPVAYAASGANAEVVDAKPIWPWVVGAALVFLVVVLILILKFK